jgi:hypothetical protein
MMPLCTGASGGLRCTCPNHLSRCCTSFSSIGANPRRSRISSFRTRSILVCPQIQRNIRISATLSCWICLLLVGLGQHSAPYNIAALIAVYRTCLLAFEVPSCHIEHQKLDAIKKSSNQRKVYIKRIRIKNNVVHKLAETYDFMRICQRVMGDFALSKTSNRITQNREGYLHAYCRKDRLCIMDWMYCMELLGCIYMSTRLRGKAPPWIHMEVLDR